MDAVLNRASCQTDNVTRGVPVMHTCAHNPHTPSSTYTHHSLKATLPMVLSNVPAVGIEWDSVTPRKNQ
jgi:metal-dependent amidase/aminoacylase/carboxypeptidase family protein